MEQNLILYLVVAVVIVFLLCSFEKQEGFEGCDRCPCNRECPFKKNCPRCKNCPYRQNKRRDCPSCQYKN
jgi:hypothetical protein